MKFEIYTSKGFKRFNLLKTSSIENFTVYSVKRFMKAGIGTIRKDGICEVAIVVDERFEVLGYDEQHFVIYHEIGHNAYNHDSKGYRDANQEKQADEYACMSLINKGFTKNNIANAFYNSISDKNSEFYERLENIEQFLYYL